MTDFIFPQRLYRISARFNQEHHLTPGLYWRIIIDGVEHKAKSLTIKTPVHTETFEKDGVLKGNIYTDGYPVFDQDHNVVVNTSW